MENLDLDIKQAYLRKIEDLLFNCEKLLEKTGELQIDLYDNPDAELEIVLSRLSQNFSSNYQLITELWHNYEDQVSSARK